MNILCFTVSGVITMLEEWGGSSRGLVVVILYESCVVGAGGGILGDMYWVGALGISIAVNAGISGAFLVYGVVCVRG